MRILFRKKERKTDGRDHVFVFCHYEDINPKFSAYIMIKLFMILAFVLFYSHIFSNCCVESLYGTILHILFPFGSMTNS